jgi:hypothetical protein
MSGLRRPANRASDWLVWAVLLGRQFYGKWKLVREQGQRMKSGALTDGHMMHYAAPNAVAAIDTVLQKVKPLGGRACTLLDQSFPTTAHTNGG